MEKFILLFTLLTVSGAWADTANASVYTLDSQSCNDSGGSATPLTSEIYTYKLSDDYSELIVETVTEESETEKEVGDIKTYSLTLYGKDAYLASPQFDGSNVNYFYVVVEEAPARVEIYVNDFMGAQCGGGLVVSSLVSK